MMKGVPVLRIYGPAPRMGYRTSMPPQQTGNSATAKARQQQTPWLQAIVPFFKKLFR